ncbi:signal peptidase II [bacterium F11]|nr:signal peptidase II [bacterium F11]
MTLYISIIFLVFVFDFLTKAMIRSNLSLGAEIHLLPIFSLVHVRNTGVAFGFFQGRNTFFLVLGLVVILVLMVWGYRCLKTDKRLALILALVIGGAAGNLLDRALFGNVTDFLDFYIGSYHWPAFNVADSAIFVGAAFLFWASFKREN